MGSCVLVFDNRGNCAFGVAHNPAVALRVVKLGSQYSQALVFAGGQCAKRLSADQRHVAIQNQRVAARVQMRQCLLERVTGAKLRRLFDEDQIVGACRGRHLLAPVPVDDADARRLQRARGRDYVCKQRPPGKQMQYLGQIGVHALALARGKDDNIDGHG